MIFGDKKAFGLKLSLTQKMTRQAAYLPMLVLCMAQATSAPATANTGQRALIITNDRGGNLQSRSTEIQKLAASGRRVELRGNCYSSCTLLLSLPATCLAPEAQLAFHGPSTNGKPLGAAAFQFWSSEMANHYREPLRSWFLTTARHRTDGYYLLQGSDLIAMGYQAC